jgi:hypothetical protein
MGRRRERRRVILELIYEVDPHGPYAPDVVCPPGVKEWGDVIGNCLDFGFDVTEFVVVADDPLASR